MTTKELMVKAVTALPDDATFEDAMDKRLLLSKIAGARKQVAAGETIPHEEVRTRLSKWLQ
jgi:hypothetical protein